MREFKLENGHKIVVSKSYAVGYTVRFYEDDRYLWEESYRTLEDIEYDFDVEF